MRKEKTEDTGIYGSFSTWNCLQKYPVQGVGIEGGVETLDLHRFLKFEA